MDTMDGMGTVLGLEGGRGISLLAPRSVDVDVRDVGRMLARRCRWSGTGNRYYSVAEHSVRCADVADQAVRLFPWAFELAGPDGWSGCRRVGLEALLHDGAEAYVGDWVRPLRRALGEEARAQLEGLEQRVEAAMTAGLGVQVGLDWGTEVRRRLLRAVDDALLVVEASELGILLGSQEREALLGRAEVCSLAALVASWAPRGCWEPWEAERMWLRKWRDLGGERALARVRGTGQ